jgi:hypothetical protein
LNLRPEVFQAELFEIAQRRQTIGFERATDSRTQAEQRAFDREVARLRALENLRGTLESSQLPSDGRGWLTRQVLKALAARTKRKAKRRQSSAKSAAQKKVADAQPDQDEQLGATPAANLGLAGLALSGGGIRSATFNLGVLQAFCKRGLFERFDYLSTVSGGSYIGGMISSLLADRSLRTCADDFPLRHAGGFEESPELKHLRSGERYLAPGRIVDKVRIPALFLRGLLINLILILPYLIGVAMLAELAYGDAMRKAYTNILNLKAQGPGFAPSPVPLKAYSIDSYGPSVVMALVLLVWALAFPVIRHQFAMNWKWRHRLEHGFALLFLATAIVAAINTLPSVMLVFRSGDFSLNFVAGGGLTTLLTIGVPLLPLLLASGAPRPQGSWQSRLMILLLGLIGPIIVLLICIQIASWRVFCIGGNEVDCPDWWIAASARLDALIGSQSLLAIKSIDVGLALVASVLFLYGWRLVDVNLTSLHGFYRDRISQAYLFCRRTGPGEGALPASNDELRLSGLAPEGSCAPYHLLNATLNLQGGGKLRGRPADFFIFSKRFVGSSTTGYMPTEEMERLDSRLDLASAVAVSGAALAPNMGTSTNRALVFVMTLLNVRTGYWLPNPACRERRVRALRGVGPFYLLLELFGLIHERSTYVNLSDGGHLENLGVYELLRRRCRYIVVCDAEADHRLDFDGLGKVMRYARRDGGIEIDLKVDRLRKTADDVSSAHYAIGRIRYKDGGDDGVLIYLKASMCREESEDIRAYRAGSTRPNRPTFPHESTSRQFFNESQFEAYRALGYHVAETLLETGKFRAGMTVNELAMNLDQGLLERQTSKTLPVMSAGA